MCTLRALLALYSTQSATFCNLYFNRTFRKKQVLDHSLLTLVQLSQQQHHDDDRLLQELASASFKNWHPPLPSRIGIRVVRELAQCLDQMEI